MTWAWMSSNDHQVNTPARTCSMDSQLAFGVRCSLESAQATVVSSWLLSSDAQRWVESLQVELAHRAAGGRPCNTVLALPGAGGRCTVDERVATPAEVYAVLRALARIEGRAHGRLLTPATAGLMGSEVLTAACMASLTVMRRQRQKRSNST